MFSKRFDYMVSFFSILGIALILTFGSARGESPKPNIPKLTDYVTDYANVLNAYDRSNLNRRLADLNKNGVGHPQVVVLIVPSLNGNDLDQFANDVFHQNGVGQKNNNNGVLTLLAMSEHRSRMEVGYDLEPVITDTQSKAILDKMIPAMRSGDVNKALNVEMDSLIPLVIQGSSDTKELHPSAASSSSNKGSGFMSGLIVILVFGAVLYGVYRLLSRTNRPNSRSSSSGYDPTPDTSYRPSPSSFNSRDSYRPSYSDTPAYTPPTYNPPVYTPPAAPTAPSGDSTLKSAVVGGLAGAATSEFLSSRRRRDDDDDSSSRSSYWGSSSSDSSSSSSSSSSDSGSSWGSSSSDSGGFSGGGGDSGGGGSDSGW